MKAWSAWGWVTAGSIFLINLIGFIDAETNSALGCGSEWPLCNGRVVPDFSNPHVLIEWTHRMLVAVGATLAFVYLTWAWIRFRRVASVVRLAQVALAFIVIQSIMGALAVLFVNPPTILALHLGFGLMAFGAAALLAVVMGQIEQERSGRPSGWSARGESLSPRVRLVAWGLWVYLYAAIYLGSYVAFRQAGPACPTWPTCPVSWPPWNSAADLDMAHRFVAVGLLAAAAGVWIVIARRAADRIDLRRGVQWVMAFVLAQILSGAVLVWSHLALWAYTIHVGLLMGLFMAISYLAWQTVGRSSDAVGAPMGRAAAGPRAAPVRR